jgi:predicted metal-dependent HD superfamily phosphohydrolase
MKTSIQKTAQDFVLDELLTNLKHIARHRVWTIKDLPVVEYIQAMNQPYRKYHGWTHIRDMLKESLTLPSGLVKDPLRLRGAILFHDVVCVPCASSNELESTVFASRFYQGQNISQIQLLIMATVHTFPFVKFGDDRDVLCDLDLTILGAEKERFAQYRLEIREECRGYCTDDEFDARTFAFFKELQGQADRDFLYRTPFFRDRYEDHTRQNIKMILAGYAL